MKAKLIKVNDYYYLRESYKSDNDGSQCERTLGTTNSQGELGKLSKQNCDEIFGVVDVNSEVESIVKTICPNDRGKGVIYGTGMAVGIQCFNKAMELNKDKVFTVEDVRKAYIYGVSNCHSFGYSAIDHTDKCIQSLQQPTEIEVEIERQCLDPTCDGVNRKGVCIPGDKPKLDLDGCLILTKKC
jgi:hypothetical protein